MIGFLWIRFAIVLVDELVTSQLEPGDLAGSFNATPVAQPAIMAVIWSLYLVRSRRVRKTFVE